MKQLIQDLKKGNTILEEVPAPQVRAGCVLIQTTRSLVSLGTERMLVEFSKSNLIEKARQQPEKVKQVIDKIKTDGLRSTLEAVFNKLGQPLPLGYCNVGNVIAIGQGVTEVKIGDQVASNGNHAEFVCIPKNLVAKIPKEVSDDEAAFTVIGAIALQGIRLLNPTFGETVVVIGLGLIGLITAELLKANGCNVIGFDFDNSKIGLARNKGINAINPSEGTDQVKYVLEKTNGIGCDGAIITASSKGNDIISQSAKMCRQRGRIILVGVVGLNINRSEFYKKELTFQVSCSYGPGRYDENYEAKGQDYPVGFVRWTEKRNFETILNAIATGKLDVKPLISEKIPLSEYDKIYCDMKRLGVIASLLCYPEGRVHDKVIKITPDSSFSSTDATIGMIGAGNFTSAIVLPSFRGLKANIKYIASENGLTATTLAKKYKIQYATSDYKGILNDPSVKLVMITTRHNLHARMVIEALRFGKNVFVEKPLCLTRIELVEIIEAQKKSNRVVSVGFNRRFAPLAIKLKSLLGDGQKNIVATMNSGFIPSDMWVHDMQTGGGRIVGEACHFIDLCSFIADSKVVSVCMNSMGINPQESTDNASILLKYENGSNAVINYFSNGSKSYAKERVEVYSQEKTFILDNWKVLTGFGVKGFSKMKSRQDKGHKEQFRLLLERLNKGGYPLISFEAITNTTMASFAAIQSMKEKKWIDIEL